VYSAAVQPRCRGRRLRPRRPQDAEYEALWRDSRTSKAKWLEYLEKRARALGLI
jgi:hypothetical protein